VNGPHPTEKVTNWRMVMVQLFSMQAEVGKKKESGRCNTFKKAQRKARWQRTAD
jgi:hypothetical protein